MDDKFETAGSLGQTPLSRRTIATGIAWSVPAITIVGASPAFAVSRVIVTSITLTGRRGNGGNDKKDVVFTWTFESNVPVTSVTGTSSDNDFTFSTFQLAGTSPSYTVSFTGSNGSANVTSVPPFTLVVNHAGGSKTFTVTARSVAEGVTETFVVTSAA